MTTTIQNIFSRQILDSRGYPTIEADVMLSDGSLGRACVPSGASTGDKEALEMRDGRKEWHGKGVEKALSNIETHIKPALVGKLPFDILNIDQIMLDRDGTYNKANLGANAILAVSLANVRAGAISRKQSLVEYIRTTVYSSDPLYPMIMPTPMMNILNGGSHADNNVDIQEFMIIPKKFSTYKEALRSGVEIFHSLKAILKSKNYNTSIGDEGGFAPDLKNNEEAIELILKAIERAGYKAGQEIMLSLDVAASEFYDKNTNQYVMENRSLSAFQLIEYYQELCMKYPIISIEDGLDQNDWTHWKTLNQSLGEKVQIVGDDLTVTNPKLLKEAIDVKAMNAILIKLNQIGTFSETIEAINMAKKNDLGVIISHRSGETEDTFISDLSVAVNAGQIKTGSLCRTDRTSKYNQLLRIEELLQSNASYNIT